MAPHILHTFLIRSPAASVNSWLRIALAGEDAFKTNFEIEEIGVRETRALYDWISKVQGPSERPLYIIESDDLVSETEATVSAYCKQ